MARTPIVTRDQVPAQFKDAFDRETADSGGVVDAGPGSVMINSPDMRERANNLVKYFREVSDLPQRIQELAMVLTARHMDCQYIWYAHSARARQHGLSDELVDALRDSKPLPALPADEDAVVKYATELFTNHKVSQATFDTALELFGAQRLTELTTMMGYYTLLAFNANAFEIDLPSGGTEPLLPI
ncbi:MAG: carboxymuconolactone decarboxylase family protein [Chloroflexi bacterium]|nr:carboxymuconolactone decarboxylase family protein [Chloroflexota bacterium]MDA1227019.1 carboxymuconolactone decarboxylase family protein [Chloroflexota bacterium]